MVLFHLYTRYYYVLQGHDPRQRPARGGHENNTQVDGMLTMEKKKMKKKRRKNKWHLKLKKIQSRSNEEERV